MQLLPISMAAEMCKTTEEDMLNIIKRSGGCLITQNHSLVLTNRNSIYAAVAMNDQRRKKMMFWLSSSILACLVTLIVFML